MKKWPLCAILMVLYSVSINSQITAPKFGKGVQITAQDSSFYMRVGFRFQTLFTHQWDIPEEGGGFEDYSSNFLIRRSRLKFDGWIHSSKLKYKAELGLTNRDIGAPDAREFNNASNVILDAYIEWNFYGNFVLRAGQSKLPGNRERVISSGNLQFVDRSRLNSRFNIDRDVGIQLKHKHNISKSFILEEIVAISQGEGRNVTRGANGGMDYTFRVEAWPFGKFASKGSYVGSAVKYEEKPKLAVGLTYNLNNNAVRERGQLGDYIRDANGALHGKDLKTFFADLMYKHRNLSIMAEFADKKTGDDIPFVFDASDNLIGTFYTGSAYSVQAGYMLKTNWEIAGRYTSVSPTEGVANNEKRYTFGLSKFVVGHKLKFQTDVTYRSVDGSDNQLIYRTQMDVHF